MKEVSIEYVSSPTYLKAMQYHPEDFEKKWQEAWKNDGVYRAEDDSIKPKFYALDMFPYPSGAGLHVGHPLGYIASDIYARYKKLKGFNVLHPMGFDSFGLPAEQYAIQTGQHPAITTQTNIARYKEQLNKIGFAYDWEREVQTSDPAYYKWTQWIFIQLFNSWYNRKSDKAEPISSLIAHFNMQGSLGLDAVAENHEQFTASEWLAFSEKQQSDILLCYRLAYLADSWVNWCPALGTVLANDEVKDGFSERGGHPVEQKLMKQWSMRITAFAERLLEGLNHIDWSDAIKEQQRNWIGKSKGSQVKFCLKDSQDLIEVFTTRPDTIFGVSFMVLAPEHPLVPQITTAEHKTDVDEYIKMAGRRTERERMADVKRISGCFTGAYAVHPFTGAPILIWIGDYVLASYGTGAVMAVPAGDQRDWDFAKHFGLPIPNIFDGADLSQGAYSEKELPLTCSGFLDGLKGEDAIERAIAEIEANKLGTGRTNYRLRDAIFGRQRYWGEPIPVYYKNDVPHTLPENELPLTLPEVDKYLPTEDGEPPLARAENWKYQNKYEYETTTMPGWAGSSWYFIRYMDPHNNANFADPEKMKYWSQVDLYIGGSEHATGHLLYSRFWTKFLYDMGYISFDEPFKKLINQGMILGRSSFVYQLSKINIEWLGENDVESEILKKEELPDVYLSKEYFEALVFMNEVNASLNSSKYNSDLIKNTDLKTSMKYSELYNALENQIQRILLLQLEKTGKKQGNIPYDFASKKNVHISFVDNDELDKHQFISNNNSINDVYFIPLDGKYICGSEVEKMSKSKLNVVTPDDLVEKFGADTLRCYEMFLGPLEQSKPWDTQGITGVSGFLKRLWRLFYDDNSLQVTNDEPTKAELKALHQCIKKVEEDLQRYSFNTVVSQFMITVNELTELKCRKKAILEPLLVMISPFAPHITEELWHATGNDGYVAQASFPAFDPAMLVQDEITYPIQFNGKRRFDMAIANGLSAKDIEALVLEAEQTKKYLEGNAPKKVIVVPGRIVNLVV